VQVTLRPSSSPNPDLPSAPGATGGIRSSADPQADRRPVILVVDDEQRNRALVQALLSRDHEVREAPDGPTALATIAEGGIDLVILDVMMPGMSGFDVCREIKKAAGDDLLPVLLVTALSDRTDRQTGLEAGADDFLSKPVDRHELTLRVRHYLRLRGQHQLLARQYEALQELAALKDDLVTLMVHDLRNPLTGICGLMQVLELDTDDPVRKADVQNAREGADKMRETLDDLLQVRLLEEGRLVIQRSNVVLAEVVRSATVSVEGAARMRGLEVDRRIPLDLRVSADAKLLRRAIENLISNAIKFSPSTQVVEVSAVRSDGKVEIRVEDRGRGVPEDKRTQLFEKFGGISVQRGSDRRGYGLGLYLVRLVAEAHGGSVSVRDREGGGTSLILTLPEGGDDPGA
jgi:two-component system sensor histidine kinase/response regulator